MASSRWGRRSALTGAVASLISAPLASFFGIARAAPSPLDPNATPRRQLRFGTLGSEGSNHSFVLRHYLRFRGIDQSKIELFQEFGDAFAKLSEGSLDYVLQVSVHPSHTEMVARYFNRVYMVDAFIAPSKPLAVITRKSVIKPISIGLQPATRDYADLSAWSQVLNEVSVATVAEGLLAGRYDSGLTARELVDKFPDRFRVDLEIGAATDTWVLFGRNAIATGEICAWPEAPVVLQFS